jgi:hypothetical protein
MHTASENLPVVWGGLEIEYEEWPAGSDVAPLLKGLPDDMCPCPHWGYISKGSMNVRYTDGTEEVIKAGEAFYLPSGHTIWTDEDTTFLFLSPEKEHKALNEHMQKKREELSQKTG